MHPTYQITDADLIQAYQNGQEKALEMLIIRHKDKVYTTIFMLVKDKFLAEDLFQETFLKIIRTIKDGRYAEQGKFLPWAVRVAHNLCMDYFRKAKVQIPIINSDGNEILSLLPIATDYISSLEKRQSHDSIRKLIEELPEEQREVIVLRIYADLSFKEIADLTSVSINTALGRMRYGLINLRKMIEQNQMVLR
ncbi:MAG: sigma-70 family RNA polymerase sigma factor [Sphingobacteriales bacterium]|nr:MAG: sigma-70 family RNA polymerase sigma factor [Sphingobacteriales bacterium]